MSINKRQRLEYVVEVTKFQNRYMMDLIGSIMLVQIFKVTRVVEVNMNL